jgi:hypothetical protein
MNYSEKYSIHVWQDNEYAVYPADYVYGLSDDSYLFKGTLQEVNAWLELKEKGFNV